MGVGPAQNGQCVHASLWFMVYGMFSCFGFPLSGRAVRRFGSRPSSPVTAFAGLLHGPQVSQLATVERRGAAARALPPTIPAVLFLGRNVLPSCQHRSQRNTAKGPLRREGGPPKKPASTNHPWDQTVSVGLRPHHSPRRPGPRHLLTWHPRSCWTPSRLLDRPMSDEPFNPATNQGLESCGWTNRHLARSPNGK